MAPMSDRDRLTPAARTTTSGRGGRPLALGVLLVAILVGAYVLMGTPGLHTPVANAPGGQTVDVAAQPDTPTAPAR